MWPPPAMVRTPTGRLWTGLATAPEGLAKPEGSKGDGLGPGVPLAVALGVALLCGAWNGFLVAILDIQPIIATLILMVAGRGIGLMINLIYQGTNPSFESPLLQGLSVGHIGLIPTRLFVGAGIFLVLWLLIRRTALGLFLESVGANSAAANLAGIN